MARDWLIDGRGLAKKVKNAGLPAGNQIKDCGVKMECPNCQYQIDNTEVSEDWPGLPAGVKFDPSDVELLGHLAAKCGVGVSEPHEFIDEFIPTLEGDEGVCYTHPENLPGAKADGSSVYFFHRIINAYASGKRKRRRIILAKDSTAKGCVRWHKTGKTKLVMKNVVLKGFKKIMVLYGTSEKGSKPDKCNWIMHQYHIGDEEDERDGEYVVSKIFYQQQKETGNIEKTYLVIEESDLGTVQVVLRTPKICAPDPPRPQKTSAENLEEPSQLDDDHSEYATCLAGESQAFDLGGVDSHLWINMMDSNAIPGDTRPNNEALLTQDCSNITDVRQQHVNASNGFTDLYNLELDAPLDFHLSDLLFASQDGLFDWLR
ncbi:SUPPRESSOR OF GAMMA RESPONSE 1-like [Primulina huaijiensis]|uniref:SUPPRESSOR OF GAMMA RESPONSE 1-like n=1 Tax=Primulina huaijiensis TaxID=1492673 RepID=UPI003CC78081